MASDLRWVADPHCMRTTDLRNAAGRLEGWVYRTPGGATGVRAYDPSTGRMPYADFGTESDARAWVEARVTEHDQESRHG